MIEGLYKKYGKGKIYLGISIMLIILNLVILVITYQVKISFSIDGEKFKYISHTERSISLQDSKGNEVKVDIENSGYVLSSIAEKYRVEYKDKVIRVDNSDWMNKGAVIKLSDGREYKKKLIKIVLNNENQAKPSEPFDVQLVNNIEDVYDFVSESGSLIGFFVISIPLILLGLSGIMYPKSLWRFQHILDVADGEPTDFAIISNVIVGVIIIGFALLMPAFMYR